MVSRGGRVRGRKGFIESLTHPRRPQRPPSEAKSLMSVTSCICLLTRKSQSAFTCFRWLWWISGALPGGPHQITTARIDRPAAWVFPRSGLEMVFATQSDCSRLSDKYTCTTRPCSICRPANLSSVIHSSVSPLVLLGSDFCLRRQTRSLCR